MSSRPLMKFVAGLTSGLEIGGRMGDRSMRHQDRRDALDVAREKNRTSAAIHRDKMGIESGKAAAYIEQARANAQKLLAQARKASASGSGTSDTDPALQGFIGKYGAGVPQDLPTPGPTIQMPDNDTLVNPPPSGFGGEAEVPEAARGGRMRAQGGPGLANVAYGVARMVNRAQQPADRSSSGTGPIPTNGTNGPGSGMGQPAAPPQGIDTGAGTGTVYRRGGPVRKYAGGGLVMNTASDIAASQRGNPDPNPSLPESEPGWMFDAQADDPRLQYEIEARRRYEQGYGAPVNEQDVPVLGRQQEFQGETGRANEGRPGAPPIRNQFDYGAAAREGREDQDAFEAVPGTRHRQDVPRPVVRGQQSGFVGEEARADERPAPIRDPGETGGFPERTPQRPATNGGAPRPAAGGGGGGGRTAINTAPRGGALADQRREKAFDPQADLYDPDNIHKVDENGMVRAALQGAVAHSKGGNTPGAVQGQGGGEGGTPTAGIGSEQRQAELFSGKGAADPKMMQQVFKVVDPDNKLSMDQKMMKAVAQVHAFHTANGDKKSADQAAFEVAQFGNKMASEHGKQAITLMQKGDTQGAINTLIEGYNFLPDGYTAAYEGGNIVLKDESGQVAQSYPMDQRALQNIALGMATGQLGWDVIGQRAGQTGMEQARAQGGSAPPGGGAAPGGLAHAPPPPAAAPAPRAQVAAQPQAAPAGPQAPPPAAPTPAAATPPTPSTAAAPPRPAPQTQAQPSAAVPSPAPPPAAKQATPPDSASASPPGVVQGDQTPQGTGIKTDAPKPKTAEDEEAEHFKKNPYAPLPKIKRTVAQEPVEVGKIRQQMQETEKEFEKQRLQMLKEAESTKVRTSKQGKAYIDKIIKHHDDRYKEWRKGAEAQLTRAQQTQARQDSHEQETVLKPRDIQLGDEEKAYTRFEERGRTGIENANRSVRGRAGMPEYDSGQKRKADVANSVHRYAKDPKDLEVLNHVAAGIWRANRDLTADQAYDHAVTATSIMPGEKDVGLNYQRGKNATQYKPVAGNLRKGLILQVRGGREFHVDENTYNDIVGLHRANWAEWEGGKADREKRERDKSGAVAGAKEALDMTLPGVFINTARDAARRLAR